MFVEIGRTVDQFVAFVIFELLTNQPESMYQEINEFAAKFRIGDGDLNTFYPREFQESEDLKKHGMFSSMLPLFLVEDDWKAYRGEFPVPGRDNPSHCDFEESTHFRGTIDSLEWSEKDHLESFYGLLNKGRYEDAWMCLNSSGWTGEEAMEALESLSQKGNCVVFCHLVEKWKSTHVGIDNY